MTRPTAAARKQQTADGPCVCTCATKSRQTYRPQSLGNNAYDYTPTCTHLWQQVLVGGAWLWQGLATCMVCIQPADAQFGGAHGDYVAVASFANQHGHALPELVCSHVPAADMRTPGVSCGSCPATSTQSVTSGQPQWSGTSACAKETQACRPAVCSG